MKKLLFFFISFFICTTIAFAQTNVTTVNDFKDYTIKLENDRRAASAKKDYATAAGLMSQWVDQYEKSTVEIKKEYKPYYPGMYYNLACYENLQGKKLAALNALDKAVAMGYSNYANTLVDTDLASLHQEKRFKTALQTLRERGDMNYILQKSAPYKNEQVKDLPAFSYQPTDAAELVKFKKDFNLDSVAGNGDEISKIKNLLHWVHNVVRHDGGSDNPALKNGKDLIAICKKDNRGINCRMMATILKDAYQAEGFKARVVTCMPKDTTDFDCHVINVVWSNTLNKWVWMDPTFNAYVSDAKGNLLSIQEVRERLKTGADLTLNEDANWNNKEKQTKEHYLDYYMSKNLYWIQCAVNSTWDLETYKKDGPVTAYINLYPGTFNTIHQSKKVSKGSVTYAISNPEYFWQKP